MDHLRAIRDAAHTGRLHGLHAVVVLRDDRLVYEDYFEGRDHRLGTPLGDVRFGPETLHDVRSVTKSIVSLLYGIAHGDAGVASVERPLLDAFPEYQDLRMDAARMRILVRHALTMTMGLEWDETLPYSDARNDERRMYDAPDLYRFVLSRSVVALPGERWRYNGGATAAIAKLVERTAGGSLIEFARERLFAPLDITEIEWMTDRAGDPLAAAGLRLRPRDLARIGQLILHRGRWAGQEIVPAAWLEESIVPRVETEPSVQYGYFWWLSSSRAGSATIPWIAAAGNGGQRLYVLPAMRLVVVVAAGNYDQPQNWRTPTAVLHEFVLPALGAGVRT